jgi:murein DD-endopeptidase MepM/ murein hydrolase activator NlpD
MGREVKLVRRPLRILSAIVLLTLVPSAAGAQDAGLEQELDDTRQEREEVIEQLEDTRARESDARERLSQLDASLDAAEARLVELREAWDAAVEVRDQALADADAARDRLQQVRDELALTEDEHADKKGQLNARVRSAYMYGQVSFADALTGTRELTDFLNTTTYVSHVIDGDRLLVEQVETLLAQVEDKRGQAQALRVEAERQAREAAAATDAAQRAADEQAEVTEQVREQRGERAEALEQLRDDRAAMEGHLAGLEEESSRIQSELAEIARQQELERQRAEEAARRAEEERRAAGEATAEASDGAGGSEPPSVSTGGWVRPASGRLTSPFGPRWGRNHNGVDLGGGMGSAVVAARDGIVVSVVTSCHPSSSWGCGGGFGNYVTVAHAGGLATVYAHLSSVSVGVGQQVAAGQGLGGVGNSGNSYGPHLHFEIRQAGAPLNPCGFINC